MWLVPRLIAERIKAWRKKRPDAALVGLIVGGPIRVGEMLIDPLFRGLHLALGFAQLVFGVCEAFLVAILGAFHRPLDCLSRMPEVLVRIMQLAKQLVRNGKA